MLLGLEQYEAAESMSGLSHLLAMANYGTRQTHDEEIVIMTQVTRTHTRAKRHMGSPVLL